MNYGEDSTFKLILILTFSGKMILILSDIGDRHADRVESILQQNTAEYSRLNLDSDSAKSILVRTEDNSFRIEAPNCSFSTSQIDAVWNSSTYFDPFIEERPIRDTNYLIWKENWNKTLGGLFSSLESTKWLNFSEDFYGENRFHQLAMSKNTGLKWPSYICSNDINYLNSFFGTRKESLLELMDQGCTEKALGDCIGNCGGLLNTSFCESKSEINCPLTKNAYMVRCSVVGNEYFIGKIRANLDKEGKIIESITNNYTAIHPPKDIKLKAIQIMNELNLTHGVFDFIVTDNSEWFFDALNPIGQYQWVEDIRGNDISSSIAKWLMMNN